MIFQKKAAGFVFAPQLLLAAACFCACADDDYVVSEEALRQGEISLYENNASSDDLKNPKIKYGKLTDVRDGRVYRTITDGELTWMAENLDYSDSSKTIYLKGNSFCMGDEESNCDVGGRLYTWSAAMNIAPNFNYERYAGSKGYVEANFRRGVCPEGWHLPSRDEMEYLLGYGIRYDEKLMDRDLKSAKGWFQDEPGSDDIGFSIVPAGVKTGLKFTGVGEIAYLWTSGEGNASSLAQVSFFSSANGSMPEIATLDKLVAASVRCVEDTTEYVEVPPDTTAEIPKKLRNVDPRLVKTGSFTDDRDGNVYGTVKIGNQTWMSENMRYLDTNTVFASHTDCNGDDEESCLLYGRLYDKFVKNYVCPDGWHIPTREDYDTLLFSTHEVRDGIDEYQPNVRWYDNTETLKARTLWNSHGDSLLNLYSGIDEYGWKALPAGYVSGDTVYRKGEALYLWVSSEDSRYNVHVISYDSHDVDCSANWNGIFSGRKISVRCVLGDLPDIGSSFDGADSSAMEGDFLVDYRDGKYYKTVTVGSQTWMAENLNYAYKSGSDSSTCYAPADSNCLKYGMLYTHAMALDLKKMFSATGESVCGEGYDCRGVCPAGWHIPSEAEWGELAEYVGGAYAAGFLLKSKDWNGQGYYGFSILPAGGRTANTEAYLWTSSMEGSGYLLEKFRTGDNAMERSVVNADFRGSVRCLKDSTLASLALEKIDVGFLGSLMPCRTEQGDSCEYGTITDKRDLKTYRTVKIGEQVWMAENLAFDYNEGSARYYKNHLYTWSAAVDSAGVFSDASAGCGYGVACEIEEPLRGICPEGFHLPSDDDWMQLFESVGDSSYASMVLRSTGGWDKYSGSDGFGWNAVPGGYYTPGFVPVPNGGGVALGGVMYEKTSANFWSSTQKNENEANILDLTVGIKEYKGFSKAAGLYIRCLQD